MKASLVNAGNDGEAIPLDCLPVILGRSFEAGIRLSDRFVSQLHCEISERDGSLFVRDLGSRHGCTINGNHVSEFPLRSGDRLSVGLTTFVVFTENSEVCLGDQSEYTEASAQQ